jgi:nucleoid-associated protein YgaU
MTESIRLNCPVCSYQDLQKNICPNCDTDVSLLRSLLELPILQPVNDTPIENIQSVPKESKLPKVWLLVLLGIAIGFVMGGWTGYSIFQSVIGDRIANNPSPSLVNKPEIVATIKATSKNQPIPTKSYIVQRGDSLEDLAQKLCGNSEEWRDFVIANPSLIGRESALEIREKLIIPQNCKGE